MYNPDVHNVQGSGFQRLTTLSPLRRPSQRFSIILVLILTLWSVSLQSVQAAGTVGDGTPESCTENALRQAFNGGGSITFNCGAEPHTIVLSQQLVTKAKTTTLDGGGLITLDGNNTTRIILNDDRLKLTVKNLRFINGRAPTNNENGTGGAIYSQYLSDLTVTNCHFENNFAQGGGWENGGGAIRTHTGHLIVDDSTFVGNKANMQGGAIQGLGTNFDITDTVFENNQAGDVGGAIFIDGALETKPNGYVKFTRVDFINNHGTEQGGAAFVYLYYRKPNNQAIFRRVRFIGNEVTGLGLGGGLRFGGPTLKVFDSVFYDNHAIGQGGGLWVDEGRTIVRNVTFSGNSARLGGGIGLGNSNKMLILTHTTITANTAEQAGGLFGEETTRLRNTIIAGNSADNPWNIRQNCSNRHINEGGNFQFPKASGTSNDPGCGKGVKVRNPQLLPYDPAQGVHPLSATSPVIDKATNKYCTPKDQRGVTRPQGDKCDPGAYELEASIPVAK